MATQEYIFGSVLLLLGFQQILAQTQSTTPTPVPPNCVCPTRPPMPAWTGPQNNNMQPTGFPGAMGPGSMMGGRGGHGGRGKHDFGMKMHGICGSDGQNYTSKCDFVNAQAVNQNLGMRPCNMNMIANLTQQMSGVSTMRPMKQVTVCLTNGQSAISTRMQLFQQLLTNPSLGIRCKSSCPCTAPTCPTFGHMGHRGEMGDELIIMEII